MADLKLTEEEAEMLDDRDEHIGKVSEIVWAIRNQMDGGAHTHSKCANDNCQQPARSGRKCTHCRFVELEALVGPKKAIAFMSAQLAVNEAVKAMYEIEKNHER